MNPDVMTRMVEIVMIAQVHLLRIIGKTRRAASAPRIRVVATVKTSPQSIGTLYGMGTGVKLDIWAANSFASFPLIASLVTITIIKRKVRRTSY